MKVLINILYLEVTSDFLFHFLILFNHEPKYVGVKNIGCPRGKNPHPLIYLLPIYVVLFGISNITLLEFPATRQSIAWHGPFGLAYTAVSDLHVTSIKLSSQQ